ncbi:Sensor protein kinase WalK [Planktothrix tepida]|uniref:PAS domain-containing protein n=1 Tax=Planktothrix tepida TaxID=1678309 RepID=UPI0020B24B02|nr:PAS domain-containing protein [Planktothrix tepida]CAD5972813.1 Sensor protein kinase WalK [Planktothrix tepida]
MMKFYQRFLPYAVAVGSTAIALLLTLNLEPFLTQSVSVFFFVAITVSTWYGGLKPGLVAIFLSTLAVNIFFVPPLGQFTTLTISDFIRLASFSLVAVVIHLLSHSLKNSKRRIEQLSQQLLEKNAEQLRMVLSAAQMGLWDWNILTGEIYWSPEHERLLGLTVGTFDGRYETFKACLHPQDHEKFNQVIERSLKERVPHQHEYRVIWPDGSIHWIEGRGQGFYDESGQPVRMTGTVMAIDERKQINTELEARVAERTTELSEVNQHLEEALTALQESEERRRLALDLTHIGFWDLHLPSGKLIWNDNLFTLHGLVPDSIEPSYELSRSIVHPDDVDWVEQQFLESIKNHTDFSIEYRLIHPDGSVHWVMPRGKAIYNESGQPVRSLGVLLDIGDYKRDQQMLDLQAVITRNMAESICLIKVDNQVIVYANPKFEQMFGYEAGELNGQFVSIVNYATKEVTAEDVSEVIISAILQNGEATYEVHNIKKDGTPFWCRATASVFKHSEYGDVLVVVQQDITIAKHLEAVRQQAEKELRQSEANFRSLSESSPIGIFMTDIHGQCIYTNPRYQMICGCTFDELLGEGCVKFLHPDDRETVTTEWSKAVSQRQEFSGEVRYVHKDGIIRFTQVRSAPILSVSDELMGYVGTVEDITERQAIEQMKSEFISIVSHELRTPLSSIRGSLGLLAAGIFKNQPDATQQMLDIAVHDTERLVRLVNDILDLERLEAQKVKLNQQWCDAITLMEQSVKTLQSLAAQSHITLLVEPSSVQVWADSDRIIQTLVNLISNAIKFSLPQSSVTLKAQELADRVLFEVTDQGRGVPADKLETIFGRFQQVDASDSRQKGGTGLGLAICQSIVQQHGGKIWVESVVGAGSKFYFTLPKQLD